MNTTQSDTVRPLAAELEAVIPPTFAVRVNPHYRAVDVRVDPAHALRADVDMVRVIEDDGTYLVVHMTHNEVIRGEARVSGSLRGFVPAMVRDLVDTF